MWRPVMFVLLTLIVILAAWFVDGLLEIYCCGRR